MDAESWSVPLNNGMLCESASQENASTYNIPKHQIYQSLHIAAIRRVTPFSELSCLLNVGFIPVTRIFDDCQQDDDDDASCP
jgi:hypothetical protein